MSSPRITELMGYIDQLDEEIVGLLARRFAYSREIGTIKLASMQPRSDPIRIADQKIRFVALCEEAGLECRMANTLINTIIEQVVNERAWL